MCYKLQEQDRIRHCYNNAVKYGTLLVQLVTVLLVGPPGVGKSSLAHSLIGKMLPFRRRSSGSISFSPKLQAEHSTNRTFIWTELSFRELLNTTADLIVPVVAANLDNDQMICPSSKRRRFFKSLAQKVKKFPVRLTKTSSISSCGNSSKNLLCTKSASLDDTIVAKITVNDVKASDDESIKSFITIMDSGGQKAFLNLYPIFVRNPSLVMIVFKMTNEPDCIWKPLPKEEFYTSGGIFTDLHQSKHSAADLIKHTMANISTYTDTTNGRSTTHICCVGTHKDKVSADTIASIDQQLTNLVNKSGYAPLVVTRDGKPTKTLFPVNNLYAGHLNFIDEVVQELREIPLKFLANQEMDKTIHEIPIRWMNLELEIREQCQLNQVKYMPYADALDIALNNHQLENEEEFLSMLQYFHNLSLLLYYHNIPYLNDIIIIDNNLILETVSKLVEFTFTGNGIGSCDFKNLKYCGIFSEDLLNHHDLGGEINPLGLLQLLISLNIVSPLPERLYFMPCVLPNIEEFTETCDDFLSANYGAKQFESVAIQFSSGSFPRGVFCSLVVCLMNSATRWTLCRSSSPDHKEVFSNFATFSLPSGHRVSIHDQMSHCQIQIRHSDCKTATVIHYDVLNTILDSLQHVCATMSLCADVGVGFHCSNKQCAHSDDHFVLSKVSLPLYELDVNSICRLSGRSNRLTEDQIIWFVKVSM